jgi:hypothetical protein
MGLVWEHFQKDQGLGPEYYTAFSNMAGMAKLRQVLAAPAEGGEML